MDVTERKETERIKSEFLAIVHHELRTPVTAINGALGLLAGGALGGITPKAAPVLEVAFRNSQLLGMLLNDLLDMEQLLAGKLRVDLAIQMLQPILAKAVQDNGWLAANSGVKVVVTEPPTPLAVRVDARRLVQVLTNLLSNAIKFSPSGATVGIRITVADNYVRVSVQDQGPGIPLSFRNRVFESFVPLSPDWGKVEVEVEVEVAGRGRG